MFGEAYGCRGSTLGDLPGCSLMTWGMLNCPDGQNAVFSLLKNEQMEWLKIFKNGEMMKVKWKRYWSNTLFKTKPSCLLPRRQVIVIWTYDNVILSKSIRPSGSDFFALTVSSSSGFRKGVFLSFAFRCQDWALVLCKLHHWPSVLPIMTHEL